MFEHSFYELQDLNAVVIDGNRYYELPDGSKVKSVTTIIGEASDKSALEKWKKRVGEAEAQKISTQAANRGTALHAICESYMLNQDTPKDSMPINVEAFRQLKPLLDKNIGKVFGVESPLYSKTLQTAGRTDCVAEWNGVPSIIDFKTSKKPKKEEWIENYFIQTTTYALMFEERTGLKIPQIVVMIYVDHEDPQIFIKRAKDYYGRVRDIFIK